MTGVLVEALKIVTEATLVALLLALWVSAIVQVHLTDKVRKISRKLGGDPPRAWFWSEKFWDYVWAQCRKPGMEGLRPLVRKADVVLTVRAVLIVTAIAAGVVFVAVRGC